MCWIPGLRGVAARGRGIRGKRVRVRGVPGVPGWGGARGLAVRQRTQVAAH